MASDGPISFRMNAQERALLELVAASQGVGVAAYAKAASLDAAKDVVEKFGIDKLAEKVRKLDEERLNLDRRAREARLRDALRFAKSSSPELVELGK